MPGAPRLLVPALSAAVLLAGCGREGERADGITVLAAASLTEAFTELGEAFEGQHPEARLTFSFGASSMLATQANEGATADVLATADEASLERVVEAGNASGPRVFARNRLALLVAPGNPKGIRALADLTQVSFVVCALEVPCGRFAAQALAKAGVTAKPSSYEENVKGVVAKVTLGEADAGIVYVTDVEAAGSKADGIDIPEEHNVVAAYPIAVLEQSGRPEVARAFVDFVLSPAGQQVLARHGFLSA